MDGTQAVEYDASGTPIQATEYDASGNPIGAPKPKPTPLAPLHVTPDIAQDMFKAGVHSKILGVTPAQAYDAKDEIQKQLSQRGGSYDDGELDPTIANDVKVGLESSIFGLHHREAMAETVRNPGLMDRFVSGLSQMVADVPFYVAGGLAGGAAGSEVPVIGNVMGAGAGAFAAPAAIREVLVQGIKNGDVKSFSDLLRRAGAVTWAATKGAVVGAATEFTGGLAPVIGKGVAGAVTTTAVKGLYQATALTTSADLLEGHLPTAGDFAGNAALIVPLNLITHGMAMTHPEAKQATMDVYAKDGTTPQETTEKLNAQPTVKPELPGLRPAIDIGVGHIEGDTNESHADIAERNLGKRAVSMESLEKDPTRADRVLENPEIHEQDVIDRAWQLKKEAVEAGVGLDGKPYRATPPPAASSSPGDASQLEQPRNPDTGEFVASPDADRYSRTSGTAPSEAAPPSAGESSETPASQQRGEPYSTAQTSGEGSDTGSKSSYPSVPREQRSTGNIEDKPLSIDDLYDRSSMKSGRGFVTPDGQFLSRMEARAWMKEHEPDTHELWLESQNGDKQAELHSEDYAEARQRAQARSLAQGDPTISQVSPQFRHRLAAAREGLNKIKAGLASKGYGKEVLRTLFAGQRDTRIAATTQLRDSLQKLIPDFHDQEALSILRDYKGTPDKLAADLERIRTEGTEREKSLIPSIERAMNPSPALLEADSKLTDYYKAALSEGQQLGFLDSDIDPSHYSPHILTRILEGEKPSGTGSPTMTTSTPFAKERSYPTILDALKTGHLDARTVNALDSLSVYGDRHATVVATKILATELTNTELGKYGTRDDHPEGWMRLAPGNDSLQEGNQSLYVPKDVADAMKPLFEAGLKGTDFAPLLKSQGYVKALELGLSLFHIKALNITAFNNMGLADFMKSIATDTKDPEFSEAERGWASDGLTTAKTSTPYEAYQGLNKSSIPTGFDKLASVPIIKQADALFRGITEYTFDVVQRKFKVQDAELKAASWMAKHPEATNEEYFAARRSIAKEVNAAYGGLNWDVLGKGKTFRDVSRLFLLAPDWTFSNVLNAKYSFEGGPAGSAARMFWAKSFATGFAMTAAASIAIGGKYDPSDTKHLDQVYLGTDKNGKEMYANWFFAGAPKDAMTLVKRTASDSPIAATADFIVSKASPALGILQGLASNKQGSGAPIYKRTDDAGKQTLDQAKFVAGRVVPITGVSAAKTVTDALTDPEHDYSYTDLLELAADSLGSPTQHQAPSGGSTGNSAKRFQSVRGGSKSRFTIKGR